MSSSMNKYITLGNDTKLEVIFGDFRIQVASKTEH